jgi:hypothetical protein
MIKQALKGERQNMARQIIDQFGGTKWCLKRKRP